MEEGRRDARPSLEIESLGVRRCAGEPEVLRVCRGVECNDQIGISAEERDIRDVKVCLSEVLEDQ